jgi:hypothetical protein
MSLFHARTPSSTQFISESVMKLFTIFSTIAQSNIAIPIISSNPSIAVTNIISSKFTRLVALPMISSYFKEFIAPFINEFLSHIYNCSVNGGGFIDRNLLGKYVKMLSVTFSIVPTVPFATRLKEWEVLLYPLLMISVLSSSIPTSSLVTIQLQVFFHFFSLLITPCGLFDHDTLIFEKMMELFPAFFTTEMEKNNVKEIFSIGYDTLQQSCQYRDEIFSDVDNHDFSLFSISSDKQLLQEFINYFLSSSFQFDLKSFSTMIDGIILSSDSLPTNSKQGNQVRSLFSQNNIQQTLEITKLQLKDMLSLWNQPILEQNTQVLSF